MVTSSNPRESAAATVPSPPSATGNLVIWRSGRSSSKPLATASVTCAAVRQPLNLSGETTTRMTSVKQHDADAGDGQTEGLGGAFQLEHLHKRRRPRSCVTWLVSPHWRSRERLPSQDGRRPGSVAFHGLRAVSRWLPPRRSGSGAVAAHLEMGNGKGLLVITTGQTFHSFEEG